MNLDNIFLSDIFDISNCNIVITDNQFNIITVNDYAKDFFGKLNLVAANNIKDFIEGFIALNENKSHLYNDIKSYNLISDNTYTKCFDNNDIKYINFSVKNLEKNSQKYIVIIFKDVSEAELLKTEIKKYKQLFADLSCNINQGYSINQIIFEKDKITDLIFLHANNSFEKLTGLNAEKVQASSFKSLTNEHEKLNNCLSAVVNEKIVKENFKILNKNINITFIPQEKGSCILLYTGLLDKSKITTNALNSIKRLKNFIDNAPDGIFVLNESARFTDCNNAAKEITGYNKETLKAMTLFDLTPPHQHALIKEAICNIKQKGSYSIECQYIRKDKKIRFWNIDFVKISDKEHISFNKDINDKMIMQEKLQYNCYHDHITGLYNRRYITKIMLDYEKTHNLYPISVIVADINGLKVVNDAFGRYAGDCLIKRTGEIIQSVCTNQDVVGKWGGDEFIILSANSNMDKVIDLISKIQKECEKNINNIKLSLSIGFKLKYNTEESFDDVIKAAENMMLQNKIYEGESFRSETINIILNTLHEKNKREEQHSVRVSRICMEIGKAMELSGNEISKLKVIGLLHDIGKIGIDETILNKNGKLSDNEFEEIKKHSEIGYRILSSSNQTSDLAQDVLTHHERYDGSGYPKGVPGNKLSLTAKILTIADAYDAMTSERPYKAAMSKSEAIAELNRCSAKQFDPYIVDIFINKVLNNTSEI